MKRALFTLVAMLFSIHLHAAEPAQVMLFGTFHFQDAGMDMVKHKMAFVAFLLVRLCI